MSPRNADYYRQRVITERAMAAASGRADVAVIHEELARQYEALIDQVELRPTFLMDEVENRHSTTG